MGKVVVIAKPESVALGLENLMEHELEELGLKIIDRRLSRLTQDEAERLYDEIREKPWFNDAVRAIQRGPVMAFLVEGEDDVAAVVKNWRGPTFDADKTDSIRGRLIRAHGKGIDKSLEAATNYVHSSGGPEEAEHEIRILFPEHAFAA